MNQERIAALLASGLLPAQVATIVGCSPGRISQLQQEESFKLLMAEKEAVSREQDIEEIAISARYNSTEHAILKQITDSLQGADLRDLTGALRVVAERQENMKARTLGTRAPAATSSTNVLVAVSLPSHALPKPAIEVNSSGEVVAVGAQTLAPLPAKAVEALFHKMNASRTAAATATEIPVAETETEPEPAVVRARAETGGYHEPETIIGSTEEGNQGVVSPSRSYPFESFLSYAASAS